MCATAKKTKPFLGLIYDKLARKQWERRASHNGKGFDVNAKFRKLDSDLLAVAQDEHDRQIAEPQPRRKDDTQAFPSESCALRFDLLVDICRNGPTVRVMGENANLAKAATAGAKATDTKKIPSVLAGEIAQQLTPG